jgi:hypothetical protein
VSDKEFEYIPSPHYTILFRIITVQTQTYLINPRLPMRISRQTCDMPSQRRDMYSSVPFSLFLTTTSRDPSYTALHPAALHHMCFSRLHPPTHTHKRTNQFLAPRLVTFPNNHSSIIPLSHYHYKKLTPADTLYLAPLQVPQRTRL